MTIFLLLRFAAILVKLGIIVALQPWLRRYTSDGLESALAACPVCQSPLMQSVHA